MHKKNMTDSPAFPSPFSKQGKYKIRNSFKPTLLRLLEIFKAGTIILALDLPAV